MRTVVAYPGTMAHAQQSARAIWEAGALDIFATTFAHRPDGATAAVLRRAWGRRPDDLLRLLSRRSVTEVPDRVVRRRPGWEMLRLAAARGGAGEIAVDLIWDRMSHDFDRWVARRYAPRAEAVMAFEYTALVTFEAASRHGVARVLQLPSRDSRESEAIRRREQARWPDLARADDGYFASRFEQRYARRREEIAAADLIVANSALTARSHVAAGADPSKVAVALLCAPPARDPSTLLEAKRSEPLSVIWAGNFGLGKGAPYLLQAWRALKAGRTARLDVYGRIDLPAALMDVPEGVVFHGPVARDELFDAYAEADVLVLPTLSDGFGMVVMEAMAQGLPVIVTDQAGAAELVTPANGFVIPAADAAALTEVLRRCLDERERLAAMREAALATARARQWADYRRDLIAALDKGLTRAGYAPGFARPLGVSSGGGLSHMTTP